MNVIVPVANLIFIFFVSYWFSKNNPSLKKLFWPSLFLKLMAGISLGIIYTFYYKEADTLLFFDDGVSLSKLGRADVKTYLNFLWFGDESFSVWGKLNYHEPRSLFFIKTISVINLFANDNYWVVSLYFSFISFICSWRLVLTLLEYFPTEKVAVVVSFLFVPSVVFWGSGIVKESLALASLFFLTHVFLRIWMKDKIGIIDWVVLVLLVWVLWQVKPYFLVLFIPVIVTSLIAKFSIRILKIKNPRFEITSWFVIFLLPLFLISLSSYNFHYENLFEVVLKNHNAFQEFSRPGGAIHFYNLRANAWSFIVNAPLAVFSGLFRPFIWEATNLFQLLVSIENLALLVLCLTSFRNWKESLISKSRILILSIVVYTILLCVFLALSTPNFGTLSRYRVGFLPFFIFLISCKNPVIERLADFLQRTFRNFVR